ncbi:MAG TPA: SAF domain-containing protein [Candidatus Nitrosopolaris sp.]|nr:SAF domain-containing protein [Candidatus Nitrosopolaris sp.]
MKRWIVALAALLAGGGVSAALLVATDQSRGTVEAYAAARDVPAGAALSREAIQLTRVSLAGGTALLFTSGDGDRLTALRAAHDIAAGQLIQRSDVMSPTSFADRRLVLIPLSAVPTTPPGAKVDLLVIAGSADHPTVAPFALGVDVVAAASGGLIVAVPAKVAAAFVFAAATMHLAAVVVEPGAADGAEIPVASADDAMALAASR